MILTTCRNQRQSKKDKPSATELSVGIRFKSTGKDYGRTSSMALKNYKLNDQDNEWIFE